MTFNSSQGSQGFRISQPLSHPSQFSSLFSSAPQNFPAPATPEKTGNSAALVAQFAQDFPLPLPSSSFLSSLRHSRLSRVYGCSSSSVSLHSSPWRFSLVQGLAAETLGGLKVKIGEKIQNSLNDRMNNAESESVHPDVEKLWNARFSSISQWLAQMAEDLKAIRAEEEEKRKSGEKRNNEKIMEMQQEINKIKDKMENQAKECEELAAALSLKIQEGERAALAKLTSLEEILQSLQEMQARQAIWIRESDERRNISSCCSSSAPSAAQPVENGQEEKIQKTQENQKPEEEIKLECSSKVLDDFPSGSPKEALEEEKIAPQQPEEAPLEAGNSPERIKQEEEILDLSQQFPPLSLSEVSLNSPAPSVFLNGASTGAPAILIRKSEKRRQQRLEALAIAKEREMKKQKKIVEVVESSDFLTQENGDFPKKLDKP